MIIAFACFVGQQRFCPGIFKREKKEVVTVKTERDNSSNWKETSSTERNNQIEEIPPDLIVTRL